MDSVLVDCLNTGLGVGGGRGDCKVGEPCRFPPVPSPNMGWSVLTSISNLCGAVTGSSILRLSIHLTMLGKRSSLLTSNFWKAV